MCVSIYLCIEKLSPTEFQFVKKLKEKKKNPANWKVMEFDPVSFLKHF